MTQTDHGLSRHKRISETEEQDRSTVEMSQSNEDSRIKSQVPNIVTISSNIVPNYDRSSGESDDSESGVRNSEVGPEIVPMKQSLGN